MCCFRLPPIPSFRELSLGSGKVWFSPVGGASSTLRVLLEFLRGDARAVTLSFTPSPHMPLRYT
eukprot:808137-Pyramimonas_sp.AAC.1